jgi:hypothetical protein
MASVLGSLADRYSRFGRCGVPVRDLMRQITEIIRPEVAWAAEQEASEGQAFVDAYGAYSAELLAVLGRLEMVRPIPTNSEDAQRAGELMALLLFEIAPSVSEIQDGLATLPSAKPDPTPSSRPMATIRASKTPSPYGEQLPIVLTGPPQPDYQPQTLRYELGPGAYRLQWSVDDGGELCGVTISLFGSDGNRDYASVSGYESSGTATWTLTSAGTYELVVYVGCVWYLKIDRI